jgi:hypothetical protein
MAKGAVSAANMMSSEIPRFRVFVAGEKSVSTFKHMKEK